CIALSISKHLGIYHYVTLQIQLSNQAPGRHPMTTLVLTGPARTGPADTGPTGTPRRRNRFFRPLTEFFAGLNLARAMAHRYDVLSHLSDAALAPRHINPHAIPRLPLN